uniref:Uncharacterized protein n=1 Tax=Arundo donax TaxID=35708 RepID=A0A0A9BFX7_ARUDO
MELESYKNNTTCSCALLR